MNRRAITALALVLALTAAACATEVDSGESVLAGSWQLESGTLHDAPIPQVSGYRITFTSEGSTFTGTAACNRYGGLFGVEAFAMTVQELVVTEMACEPAVMESEQAYLTALNLVDLAGREDGALVLTGRGVELRFIALPPVPTAALIGTVWVLESLVDGDVVSSAVGDNLTFELNDDGTLVALTGCRTLTGSYVVVGDEIETPQLGAAGECTADLVRQDGHVIGVFEGGFTTDIDGDRLTLTAAGEQGLVYRAG